MDYYAIGQRIRKIRKARGYTQEMLAEMVDISVVHMSHIENGTTKLSLPVLVKMASALEVHADDLLYDVNSIERSDTIDAIVRTLDSCSTQQPKIIEQILNAAKVALDQYL